MTAQAGDRVATIPLRTLLTAEHAVLSDSLGQLWDGNGPLSDLGDMDVLATFLLQQSRDSPVSRWQPWLDLFPAESQSLCQYTPEEKDLLGNCLAADLAFGLQQQTLQSAFNIRKHLDRVPRHAAWFTDDGFAWAHFILRSRTHNVGIQDNEGNWHKAMCLVPVADLMNT